MLFSAWNGTCVILEGRGRVQRKPWDIISDAEGDLEGTGLNSGDSTHSTRKGSRHESLSAWVEGYQRRWFISRAFDRTTEVQEPYIKRGQRIIFWQAIWAGFLVYGVLVAAFYAGVS